MTTPAERALLLAIQNYPGIREHIGTELHDGLIALLAAVEREQQPKQGCDHTLIPGEVCATCQNPTWRPDCGNQDATQTPLVHGVTCAKVEHAGAGYLHSQKDDGPYDVDGVLYCGRCHAYLDDLRT